LLLALSRITLDSVIAPIRMSCELPNLWGKLLHAGRT